jgi:hypothetical protein
MFVVTRSFRLFSKASQVNKEVVSARNMCLFRSGTTTKEDGAYVVDFNDGAFGRELAVI